LLPVVDALTDLAEPQSASSPPVRTMPAVSDVTDKPNQNIERLVLTVVSRLPRPRTFASWR
jgi:hypothetical protein